MDPAFLTVQPGASVRAKFDYLSTDDSSLSFKKGDVLLFLSCIASSGWIDGLNQAGERGWFPSNYVEIISQRPAPKQQSKWVRLTASDGNSIYWYNTVTGATTWDLPAGEQDDPIATAPDALSRDSAYQSGTSADVWASTLKNSTAEKLPPNWRAKKTPQGRAYYYNVITDQTTWTLDDVNPETGETNPPPTSIEKSLSRDSNNRLSSANEEDASWSWSKMTADVVQAVHNIIHATTKETLIPLASTMVEAIRTMLYASGTARKDAGALAGSRQLQQHHRQIMATLSKLVLAAKTASGLWPPPDALAELHQAANEVLSAVKNFATAAQEAGVQVQSLGHVPRDNVSPHAGTASSSAHSDVQHNGSSNMASLQVPTTSERRWSNSAITKEPLAKNNNNVGNQQSDTSSIQQQTSNPQLVASLERFSQSVVHMITDLGQAVKSGNCDSQQLISQVRSAVTEVGNFLSLVDELPLDTLPDESTTEFKVAKLSLYNTISGLVMATQTATSPLAPSNAVEQALLATGLVEKAVKDLLIATKFMVAETEHLERQAFMEQQNKPSGPTIPRRAASTGQIDFERADELKSGQNESRREVSMPPLGSNGTQQRIMTIASLRPGCNVPLTTPPALSLPTNYTPPDQGELSAKSSTERLKLFLQPAASVASRTHGRNHQSQTSSTNSTSSSIYKSWFMAYDYKSQDIVMNAEGRVKGGTLESLVERLTMHDSLDTHYYQSFMLTYRAFISTTLLFDLLFKRFTMQPPQGLNEDELTLWTEKKQTPVRLRVFNVLKQWVETYCLDNEEDAANLVRLRVFCTDHIQIVLPTPGAQLDKLLEKRRTGGAVAVRRFLTGISSIVPPPPIFHNGTKKIKFLEIDPLEFARQMTLMEMKGFVKIQPVEFMKKAWSDKQNPVSVNIRNMISLSNKITGWVASNILAERDIKRRSTRVKHFIMIAERCRALNNFNTLMSVLAGLQSAPIHRLKRTWDILPVKMIQSLDTLRKLMNPAKNFSTYRDSLKGVTPPCVPFLGVYLTDLTFIEDGNPDFIKPPSTSQPSSPTSPTQLSGVRLVNFAKHAKTADVVREIQTFQHVVYSFTGVSELQIFLGQCLDEAKHTDEQVLYDTSLQLEPKESREDDKLARLMHESGFL
ncbi:hypothetical protein SeLEV6574_g06897 [Synchytrium endobioticum]|uniref:Ras GEF n=1 Tax=Synchytrium endobioticum TaxID=286115 RepID=A0A507CM75_9FUNG|nr:hypothetical protein SeLEV6574_g06897 [Synchytrium endobioticum]